MLTAYSEQHALRDAKTELYNGELVAPFECPLRVEYVLRQVREVGLGEVIAPQDFGIEKICRLHHPEYIEFLRTAWAQWQASGAKGEAIPTSFPVRGMQQRAPRHIDGKIGYYALAAETSICDGTWEAALASANVALTAQQRIGGGEAAAFALCRPPGHHAAADLYGGYCFVNNAAISAQAFLDQGAARVAILDVDFHHGNGTQSLFYRRNDVLFVSLHGEPQHAFPYFLGYRDETGDGDGAGFNVNYPMPPNTAWGAWGAALGDACKRIREFAPDALVVSLGVDAYEHDPISFFKLSSDDFSRCGGAIGALGVPTLFVMEGGYAVREIGVNTVNVLSGFHQR
ncbi:MAG: histone deacetylase family protein [bacterium]